MAKAYLAMLTPAGQQEVIQQVTEIAGKDWKSYEKEFNELEEHASILHAFGSKGMACCEVRPQYTVSGRKAFIYLGLDMFDFREIELDVTVDG